MHGGTTAGALSSAVLLSIALTACGGGSSGVAPLAGGGSASASGSAAGSTPSAGPTRAITVRISGTKVKPPPATIMVLKGTRVVLTVTSDRDDEVHVHGYNLEKELSPGTPGTLSFVADQVGRVEVETHKSGLTLFELVTR